MRVYAYPNSSSFVDFFIDFISHRYCVIWRSGSFACTSTELYSVALDKYVSANQKKKKKKKKKLSPVTFISIYMHIYIYTHTYTYKLALKNTSLTQVCFMGSDGTSSSQ